MDIGYIHRTLAEAEECLAEAQAELSYYYSDIEPTEPDEEMEKALLEEIAAYEAEVEEKQWEEEHRKAWHDPDSGDNTLDSAFGSWTEYYHMRGIF